MTSYFLEHAVKKLETGRSDRDVTVSFLIIFGQHYLNAITDIRLQDGRPAIEPCNSVLLWGRLMTAGYWKIIA